MSSQLNPEEFGEEQLRRGFDNAYQQAVFYLVKFGCTGQTLNTFQSRIEMDGLIVALNAESYREGDFVRLKDSESGEDTAMFTDRVNIHKQLFEDVFAEEKGAVHDAHITGLALRHSLLLAHSYYFPISLIQVDASEERKIEVVTDFYKRGLDYEAAPLDEALEPEARHIGFAFRFCQGFAALTLLDQMQRSVSDQRTGKALAPDLARNILAGIIEKARTHEDDVVKALGNPVLPAVIKQTISQHTEVYNRTHR